MTDKITVNEAFEQLTGWDEIAIKKAFGAEVTAMRKQPFTFARALAFVDFRRGGKNDRDAYETALGLTIRDLNDHFLEDEDEPMPDEPVTESGKGD